MTIATLTLFSRNDICREKAHFLFDAKHKRINEKVTQWQLHTHSHVFFRTRKHFACNNREMINIIGKNANSFDSNINYI